MEDKSVFETPLKIDGSLGASLEALASFCDFLQEDGNGFDEVVQAKEYPQILPLITALEVPSKTAIQRQKWLTERAINDFAFQQIDYAKIFGEKVLVCGFPLHIRNILKNSRTSIVTVPPSLNKEQKTKFEDKVEEFKKENNKRVEICNRDFEAVGEKINSADSILTEIYGIRKTMEAAACIYVHLSSFSTYIITWAYYLKKPIFLIASRLQCDALFKNHYYNCPLAGESISYNYFCELIMEEGPMYFSPRSVYGKAYY